MNLDGMVHLTDLSWSKSGEEALSEYKKGQMIKVKVLDIDAEKERISLGVKQLETDTFSSSSLGQH
jgi:small subunit ribosomal protein S1